MKYSTQICLCLSSLCMVHTTYAITQKDVQTIAKAIGFIEGAPKGDIEVAVVVDGAAGKEAADQFITLGKEEKLTGKITSPAELSSTSAKVVYIPSGISNFDAIFSAATAKKLITISNSDACIKAKKCAVSVNTDPKVDITVSKSAASQTGVAFGSAFKMMIKEVD